MGPAADARPLAALLPPLAPLGMGATFTLDEVSTLPLVLVALHAYLLAKNTAMQPCHTSFTNKIASPPRVLWVDLVDCDGGDAVLVLHLQDLGRAQRAAVLRPSHL